MAGLFDDFQPAAQSGLFDDFQPPASPSFTQRLLDAWTGATRGPSGKTGFAGIGESIGPAGRILANAATFNAADPVIGWLEAKTSGADPTATIANERAQTQRARDAFGWGALPLDVAGYAASPLGFAGRTAGAGAGLLSRAASGALEGAGAGAAYAVGGDIGDPNKNMPSDALYGAQMGGLFGGAATPIAGGLAAGANAIGRKLAPAISSTRALQNAKNAAYDALDYTYDSNDASKLADAVDASFRKKGMTQFSTPKEFWFNNDVQNALSGNDVSMQNLRDLRDRANNELNPSYAAKFGEHVNGFFQNVDPVGASADEAATALREANAANSRFKNSALMDQWEYNAAHGGSSVPKQAGAYIRSDEADRFLTAPQIEALSRLSQGNTGSNLADFATKHGYAIGAHVVPEAILGGALGAAEHIPYAAHAALGLGVGIPATLAAASQMGGAARAPLIDAARRALTDTPAAWRMDPGTQSALQQLIMRGALTGWN